MMNVVELKPGREKSLLRRHPWVFSGAIAKVEGAPESGETVVVQDSHGSVLGLGAYSPFSQIRVRMWTWGSAEPVDAGFFRARLQAALAYRQWLAGWAEFTGPETGGEGVMRSGRLVHAESDGLPGLIVDRYGDVLVMQVLSAGVERWRQVIADALGELTGVRGIYERSDVEVRKLEGLEMRTGPLRGDPPSRVVITEGELDFLVDFSSGHKTGFYLDQRVNRRLVRQLSAGKDVLDCFAYTGGFALNALAGGARAVTAIEASEEARALAKGNLAANNLPEERCEWITGDVFQQLRRFRDQARSFDLIILDPPKFAPTAAQAEKASRGYKDINLLAFKLLRPGGLLVTFSCSGGIKAGLFQKIVAGAALDAGIHARILRHLEQSPDHPVALHFPEGAYLKGLLVQVGSQRR